MDIAAQGQSTPVFDQLRRVGPLSLSALILAFAPFWQFNFGVNGDASWIITMCERVLAGDRLYVDLIETNPPFTIWLYMPAVLAARLVGVTPEFMVHLLTYAICIGGLALAAAIVQRGKLPDRQGLLAILPVLVGLLVLLPGNSFAEREHIGVALLLPLLALMAWRAMPNAQPGLGWAVLAGLTASIILLVKPYYALMVLAPALWLAWKRRSVWTLLAPEYWVVGAVCVAYLAAVMTLHPEFMSTVYPLLRNTYMRTGRPFWVMQIYGPTVLILALLIFRLQRGSRASDLTILTLVSAAAGLIPLVYQGKGWAYHFYPSVFLLLSALAYCFRQKLATQAGKRPALVTMILVATAFVVSAVPFMLHYKSPQSVIDTVRNAAPANPSVALIGAGIEAGHPFTRRVGGHWIGSYCSDWLGGFALVWGKIDRENGRTDMLARYDAIVEDYSARKSKQLKAANPDIVLLQKADTIWTDPFLARPDMAGFMDRYDMIAEDYGIWVYLLKPQFRG